MGMVFPELINNFLYFSITVTNYLYAVILLILVAMTGGFALTVRFLIEGK